MKLSLLAAFCFSFISLAALAVDPVRVLVVSEVEGVRSDFANLLKARGVQVEAAADFDDARLQAADVLLLHRAEPKLLSPDRRALLEAFAQRGGGFVILHDAVASGDASWWKPLVGGAWTEASRKFASRMTLYVATDQHAIVRDASPFDLDDDTLYDLELDPRAQVLGSAFTAKVTNARNKERAAKDQRPDRASIYDLQPQMWAYEAPATDGAKAHRAFVLLQGSAATLKHVSIRNFLLRGVAWTAGRESADELCTKEELATLRYPQDGPRRATDTIKEFELHPGFKASVVAAEPLINKPIAVQWDARGRMWIAETPEYPNGRRPITAEPWKETSSLAPGNYDRPARDRISILEDTDGDGVMDKKTVFFEGLELVTGFCLTGDGAIVIGQPDISFLHDTNGDDKADNVERLFTGFTPGDTHFVVNHFIVAPDGWIYANTGGGDGGRSAKDNRAMAKLSSGVFRFKADGSAIEQVSSKGGNAFGLDVTSDGELFFGQATSGNPVQHVVLPEKILARGKVGNTAGAESVIKGRKVVRREMPTRAALMQIDAVGGYSAACASLIYEGGAWPAEWTRGVFCTEPLLDIIHHEALKPSGATFTGEMVVTDKEWLYSRDYWFMPVEVAVGPDGAMYVLDFYTPVVAHSDSRGPVHGRANASVRPDREHYFGRVYRIQHDAARKLEVPDLSKADTAGLVNAFSHPSRTVRFNAQRLLMERADKTGAIAALKPVADGEKFAPARILALWSLQRLGQLAPATLRAALSDGDAGVRKTALLIVEAGAPVPAGLTASLNDADPRVRLTALRALSATAMNADTAAALLALLPKLDDDWSRSAAVAAASSNAAPVLIAMLGGKTPGDNTALDLAAALSSTLAEQRDSAGLAKVIIAAAAAPAESSTLVRAILETAARRLPAPPYGEPVFWSALRTLLTSPDRTLAAAVLPFIAAWDTSGKLKPLAAQRVAEFLALARDAAQPDAARTAAIRGLLGARGLDAQIFPALATLSAAPLSDAVRQDLIADLAATGEAGLGVALTTAWPQLPPLGQAAAFDALAGRAEWSNAVLDALEAKTIAPKTLGTARLARLRTHPDAATAKRARGVIDALGGGSDPAKDETIAKLRVLIEQGAGDAAKGRASYTAACAICHQFNGEGKEVGPKLDGIGVHGAGELLVHIVDPNRVVDHEHRTWSLALKNGSFVTGIIARENERGITLRLPGGVEQEIKTADVKSRQDTGISLMPEGFEALGADALRDLIDYLAGADNRFRALPLDRAFTADTRRGLYQSQEQVNDTVQPIRYGVIKAEGIPFVLSDPATTPTGSNVIVLQGGGPDSFARTLPQRVEIPVGFAAGNLHFLGGVAGWGNAKEDKPAMKATLVFADGKTQVEELRANEVFLDYPSLDEAPGSKRVNGLVRGNHVRLFTIPVENRATLQSLVLESYGNGIAPTTLAITADQSAPIPRSSERR